MSNDNETKNDNVVLNNIDDILDNEPIYCFDCREYIKSSEWIEHFEMHEHDFYNPDGI